MWSTYLDMKQHPVWGAFVNDLETEASGVLAGKPYVALLDTLGVIQVEGEDAQTFLQGQTTCDFAAIAGGHPKLGAHCNIKGRAQSTFIATTWNNKFYLVLPQDQRQPTLDALKKFALFSKVTLTACDHILVAGFGGNTIEQILGESFEQCPAEGQSVSFSDKQLVHVPHAGLLALINDSMAAAFLEQTQSHLAVCGSNTWQLEQIRNGVLHLPAALSEQWIPQEFNYDLIEGVSFKKGCYKGQEIIARIHYRGQTKTRAFALEIQSESAINIGDKITGGSIIACAYVSEHTQLALAVLKIDNAESQNLQLDQNEAAQIQVLSAPYAIT